MGLLVVVSVVTDVIRHKPAVRVPFNASQYVILIATAGAVYTSLGGTTSPTPGQIPAFVAAALVLMLVNRLLVRIAVGLYEHRPLTLANLFAEAHVELLEGAVQCGVVLVALPVAGHQPVLPLILLLPALPIFVAARATDRAEALAARRGLGDEEQARLAQRHKELAATTELQLARFAADLHDGPVQLFRGLLGQIQMVKAGIANGDPDAARVLQEAEERVLAESANLRLLVAQLRPPVMQRYGLAGALEHLAEQFGATGGFACSFQANIPTDLSTDSAQPLSEELEVVLYRVAQEALTNVVNHADASHVHMVIRRRR